MARKKITSNILFWVLILLVVVLAGLAISVFKISQQLETSLSPTMSSPPITFDCACTGAEGGIIYPDITVELHDWDNEPLHNEMNAICEADCQEVNNDPNADGSVVTAPII